MEEIRTFICIDFPNEIIKEVARMQLLIKNKKFTGKLTELENLHLTLKFIGEINKETLNKIITSLSKINFKKFEASLQESGIFSYKNSPRIAWIKIGGKETYNLQKEVDSTLSQFIPKEKRFMSHLTIARIKYVKDKKDFVNFIKKLPTKQIKFKVSSFKLKSSQLTSLGPVYKTLKTYKLK
jgi:RNA 2',3'-cyclic 3'-phosphodiesterase